MPPSAADEDEPAADEDEPAEDEDEPAEDEDEPAEDEDSASDDELLTSAAEEELRAPEEEDAGPLLESPEELAFPADVELEETAAATHPPRTSQRSPGPHAASTRHPRAHCWSTHV